MFNRLLLRLAFGSFACVLGGWSSASGAETGQDARLRSIVDGAMKPILEQLDVPGLAVAVTIDGKRAFFDYGLAVKSPAVPVTRDTLFELGSVSKTFTATLSTLAEVEGKLSLNDSVGAYLPELKGGAISEVRLRDLGTHTGGGFPLQLPEDVKNQDQLMAYYRAWRPQFAAGARRTYANPSVGLLGLVAAKAMGQSFESLMQRRLFPELGLKRTFIHVPATEMASYAWGYTQKGDRVRVTDGPLAAEAYAVKSNVVDMTRFLELNMGVGAAPEKIRRALDATHIGYFRSGELIQDLIWEQYPLPMDLEKLVAGNAPGMARNATEATALIPPTPPRDDVVLNKTGATNGFGAYVAYIPSLKLGIVMLANKNYPNEARVKAAYQVLSQLLN